MPRTHKRNLSPALKESALNELFEEIKKIYSKKDLGLFISSFLTAGEVDSILRRIITRDLLLRGKNYRNIKEELEISGNMISKIKHAISGTEKKVKARSIVETKTKKTNKTA